LTCLRPSISPLISHQYRLPGARNGEEAPSQTQAPLGIHVADLVRIAITYPIRSTSAEVVTDVSGLSVSPHTATLARAESPNLDRLDTFLVSEKCRIARTNLKMPIRVVPRPTSLEARIAKRSTQDCLYDLPLLYGLHSGMPACGL